MMQDVLPVQGPHLDHLRKALCRVETHRFQSALLSCPLPCLAESWSHLHAYGSRTDLNPTPNSEDTGKASSHSAPPAHHPMFCGNKWASGKHLSAVVSAGSCVVPAVAVLMGRCQQALLRTAESWLFSHSKGSALLHRGTDPPGPAHSQAAEPPNLVTVQTLKPSGSGLDTGPSKVKPCSCGGQGSIQFGFLKDIYQLLNIFLKPSRAL